MQINDDLIMYVSDLARLELDEEEKAQAKKDLTDMLNYIDTLNELDTSDAPEMSHPFEAVNCFREDRVINFDDHENLIRNAPDRRDSYIKVFKTVE